MRMIIALLFTALLVQQAAAQDLCLGTFSNFRFNSEAGDLQGVEIKIVYTRIGKQAAIQFSEGEPGPLTVVSVTCDGSHITLKIPGDGGRMASYFNGSVSKDSMSGELVYEHGGKENLVLKRRKGYWDK